MKHAIVWILLGVSGLCAAAEPVVLTLNDVIEQALVQSYGLQQKMIDVEVAQMKSRNNWAQVLPGISAGAGLNYSNNLFTDTSSSQNQSQSPLRYSTSLSLSLQLNGGIPYTIKNNNLTYQTQIQGYENSRRQLEVQVAKTFYNLIAERQNLDILQDVLTLSERQYDKDQTAFRNGLINQLTLIRSQLSVESARLSLVKAQTQYNINKEAFLMLLGYDRKLDASFEGSLNINQVVLDADNLIQTYLQKRPDIVSQRYRIEILDNTRKQTLMNGRAPSLSFSAGWNGQWSKKFSDSISGGISLGIPIDSWVPGSKSDQSIKTASGETEKAKLELQNLEDTAATQIRSLTANLQDSWESITISRLKVQIAELTYNLTEQGFQNGTVEFIDLETARKDMLQARQQLLVEETNYKNMVFDLAGALNVHWQDLMGSGS